MPSNDIQIERLRSNVNRPSMWNSFQPLERQKPQLMPPYFSLFCFDFVIRRVYFLFEV